MDQKGPGALFDLAEELGSRHQLAHAVALCFIENIAFCRPAVKRTNVDLGALRAYIPRHLKRRAGRLGTAWAGGRTAEQHGLTGAGGKCCWLVKTRIIGAA